MSFEGSPFSFLVFQDIIYQVKMTFNKEFDAVTRLKEQEISRVNERNVRISEILQQLELQEKIWVATFSDNEKPERALTVSESEVWYLKQLFLSPCTLMVQICFRMLHPSQSPDIKKQLLSNVIMYTSFKALFSKDTRTLLY